MAMKGFQPRTIFAVLPILAMASLANSFPLSTRSRWIVDASSGQRVKLHCVNWAGHMETMLPEGLDQKPVDDLALKIASLGFNCVRLTWATYMYTNATYANLTVANSFNSLGLKEALAGVARNNPSFLSRTLIEAQEAVVDALGRAGVMVVLDNHVSKPEWCCGDDDGNGFFGDVFFDPDEWVHGWNQVARRYKGKRQVIGMSLRNELRGPRSSQLGWYLNMRRGVETIHQANPDVLVIVSGLGYDTDLSFLKQKPLGAKVDDKLVYEAHWYAFSNGKREVWATMSPSWACENLTAVFEESAGFVADATETPLFISEFGLDQTGANVGGNHFLTCFLKYATERDLDWAMWALQGSYYQRHGNPGDEEMYGVLDKNFHNLRNPKFPERYRLLQAKIKDPVSEGTPHQILYHPLSGHCAFVKENNTIEATDCHKRSRWIYAGNGTPIKLMGTHLCLKLVGEGEAVTLSDDCNSDWKSKWSVVSSAKVQLAARDEEGKLHCLEKRDLNSYLSTIVTRECVCLEGMRCADENQQVQWFNLVSSNVV